MLSGKRFTIIGQGVSDADLRDAAFRNGVSTIYGKTVNGSPMLSVAPDLTDIVWMEWFAIVDPDGGVLRMKVSERARDILRRALDSEN